MERVICNFCDKDLRIISHQHRIRYMWISWIKKKGFWNGFPFLLRQGTSFYLLHASVVHLGLGNFNYISFPLSFIIFILPKLVIVIRLWYCKFIKRFLKISQIPPTTYYSHESLLKCTAILSFLSPRKSSAPICRIFRLPTNKATTASVLLA